MFSLDPRKFRLEYCKLGSLALLFIRGGARAGVRNLDAMVGLLDVVGFAATAVGVIVMAGISLVVDVAGFVMIVVLF